MEHVLIEHPDYCFRAFRISLFKMFLVFVV